MSKKTLFSSLVLISALTISGCAPDVNPNTDPDPIETTTSPADGLELPPGIPLLAENIIPASFAKTDTGWTATFTGDIAEVPDRVLTAMEEDGWKVTSDEATKTYTGDNAVYTVVFTPVSGDPAGGAYIATITKK